MLNAEKYKDEIVKVGYDFALFANKPIVACHSDEYECDTCKFHNDFTGCRAKRIKWLLEEYKEPIKPILTDKEKAYIKNVIEPLNVVVDYIRKCENYTSEDNIFYTVVVRVKHSEIFDCSYVLIDFVVTEDMPFEGMELKKRYTSEELGL